MSQLKRFWAKAVLKILKTEIAKRDMTYNELKNKLAAIDVQETETNIKNKLSRGTFSAIFFVQCLRAMNIQTLSFDEAVFEKKEKSDKTDTKFL